MRIITTFVCLLGISTSYACNNTLIYLKGQDKSDQQGLQGTYEVSYKDSIETVVNDHVFPLPKTIPTASMNGPKEIELLPPASSCGAKPYVVCSGVSTMQPGKSYVVSFTGSSTAPYTCKVTLLPKPKPQPYKG